ncbi:MAG TPA: nucleoside recognition protein [Thermoplasmata archaeon]|nr:nucleoside recognition protein [Thermoplasmata archaeon]
MFYQYILQSVVFIVAGVIFANIIVETNITAKLNVLAKPLCKASNLPDECIFATLICLVNPTAGKATLAELYKNKRITEQETIATTMLCTLPTVVGESLFRVHAPVALVLLGPVLGSVYVGLNLLSALIQAAATVAYTRIKIPSSAHHSQAIYKDMPQTKININRKIIKKSIKNSTKTLKKIIPLLILTTLIIGMLIQTNNLTYITKIFAPPLNYIQLPGESITVLTAQFIHFTAGYAVVGSLLSQNLITQKQALLTLLIGSMAVITMIYIKYSTAMYLSLFGKFGIRITLVNYSASMLAKTLIILGIIYIL